MPTYVFDKDSFSTKDYGPFIGSWVWIIPMKSESNFSQIQTGLFQEIFQIEDKGLNTLITCIIINKKSLIKDCHDFQLHNIRFFIKTNI